jgi:hypothetical protein
MITLSRSGGVHGLRAVVGFHAALARCRAGPARLRFQVRIRCWTTACHRLADVLVGDAGQCPVAAELLGNPVQRQPSSAVGAARRCSVGRPGMLGRGEHCYRGG